MQFPANSNQLLIAICIWINSSQRLSVDFFVSIAIKTLGYEIINLGRGAPVSLGEFIATMESIAGKRANLELRPKPKGDGYITFANIAKAQKLLGYEPQVSVREGIESFWQWYEHEVLK